MLSPFGFRVVVGLNTAPKTPPVIVPTQFGATSAAFTTCRQLAFKFTELVSTTQTHTDAAQLQNSSTL